MAGPVPASILPMQEVAKPVPSLLVQPGMQGGSMRNPLRLTALCAFAALAGCGGGSGSGTTCGPTRSLHSGGSVPLVSNMVIYRILPKAGINGVVPGEDAGYFITANNGSSFRIVWTGDVHQS